MRGECWEISRQFGSDATKQSRSTFHQRSRNPSRNGQVAFLACETNGGLRVASMACTTKENGIIACQLMDSRKMCNITHRVTKIAGVAISGITARLEPKTLRVHMGNRRRIRSHFEPRVVKSPRKIHSFVISCPSPSQVKAKYSRRLASSIADWRSNDDLRCHQADRVKPR